jgi:hypothetical protein
MFAGEICFSFEILSNSNHADIIRHFFLGCCGAIFHLSEQCERQALCVEE